MPTGGYQFITFVQGAQLRSTIDYIFLPQTQITAVRDRAKGSGLFQNFSGDPELQFCLLQMPNVFTKFCTQSLAGVVERRFVVGKSPFKRGLGETHISLVWLAVLRCHCCLVNHG